MKGHVTFLWFSANNDTFLYEHVLTVRGHFLNYPFIHMKLKLGVIVGTAIVIQLLEHSQVLTFPTSCQTVFNFLLKVFQVIPSETSHSEKQSCGKYHLQVHLHEGHWVL